MAARDAALLALAREAREAQARAREALDRLEAAMARTPEDEAAELADALADATERGWFTGAEALRLADALAEAAALDGGERPPLCRALDRFEGDARALGQALASLAEAPPAGFTVERGPRERGGYAWRAMRV